jgi:CTP:molybdopterin cytidylyltransferase MocA
MRTEKDLAAIILSAGFSSRMAAFKPLLSMGNSTVIETVINIFLQAGISDITVVLGHRADDLKPVVDRSHVRWILNERYDEGMYSSVVSGVSGLYSARAEVKGVFLLPVDMPLISSLTIKKITMAYSISGSHIFYPTYLKQRGHPPLIPSDLFSEILAWNGPGGLRSFLERYEARASGVEVQDKGILMDIDTPEDYSEICRVYGKRDE